MGIFSKKDKKQESTNLADRSDYPSGPIAGRFF